MLLKTWFVQSEKEEAIIVASDEYFARQYADQMGFHGKLNLVEQPTCFIRELDEAID